MPKRKSVSIKDVARESQASLTTVSLVLNKRDRRISSATRERILKTVDRLGYRPSRLAQGLQAQKSGFLAILVPQLRHAFADAYFGELISAIHDRARESGYKILLEVADATYVDQHQHLEIFDRHIVDGMLCLGVTNSDRYLQEFVTSDRPMLVVNNTITGVDLNYVKCDYEEAGRLAGKYLRDLGHQQIGLIHGAHEVQTTLDLQQGFEKALGRKLAPASMEDGLYTEEGGASAAVKLLKRAAELTAVFAGNDKMAIGAISGLKSIGLRVPEDVSVVGCDDIHSAAFCDPALTTVHTPLYELGRRACGQLLDLVNGEANTVREMHPVSLTVRKSAASPK
jgi:LacI family transcriptional regulator